jgi:hypothetical protein
MNSKLILILIILTTLTSDMFCQVEGDWFTPLRNKLLHILITKDSISFRKCSFEKEMQDYGYIDMAFKVEKKVNESYIVSMTDDSIKYYYLFCFQVINGINYMNIESADKKFSTITEAENENPNFKKQSLNITLLSALELDKIRQNKIVEKMTTNDFKKFASSIMKSDSIYRQRVVRKYKFTYLYAESTNRILLADIGINSLVKGSILDSMFERFQENPETKEMFSKMTE